MNKPDIQIIYVDMDGVLANFRAKYIEVFNEDEFEKASLETVDECRKLGYNPTRWVDMIRRYGAVEAARRLVVCADIQSGFTELVERNRADLTIESAVLSPRWSLLFGPDVREAARWRLAQAGFIEDAE